MQDKPIRRWPGYLLIGFFVLVALFCGYQLHDALVSDMVLAGRRYNRFWATREGAPTAYWWTVGLYGANFLLCLFFAAVLAISLLRLRSKP